jgi:hypothetical protein
VFNLQCFALGNPKPLVFNMAASENECGSSQLPKRKLPASDSDDQFSYFSFGAQITAY